MKKSLILLVFGLFIFGCKPAFNLTSEKTKLVSLAKGDYRNNDYLNSFPNVVKDSIPKDKLYKHLDSVRHSLDSIFFKAQDVISQDIQIEKISSTRKIFDNYFKIVAYYNSLKIQGNVGNLYLHDYKTHLDSELIKYSEDDSKILSTKIQGYILAYWTKESEKWKFLPYSDLYNEKLFGLKTTQNIIDLYFDDIFVPSQKKWDKESITIFTEVYDEERKTYIDNGIDFEKLLKCRRKFQEKAEEEFDGEIPDKYYESAYFIKHSLKCRIYSKNQN